MLNQALWSIPTPDRIKHRPISRTGFYVPWFVYVSHETGEPDFRVIGPGKMEQAVKRNLCWICGGALGVHRASVIGAMCAVNRCISEPPAHFECAEYAARACPFLANPRAKRNEKNLPEERIEPAGTIRRNPGVVAVWVAREIKPFRHEHSVLFRLGEPERVLWFAEGRPATRAEVLHSIDTGLPLLYDEADRQGIDRAEVLKDIDAVEKWFPRAAA
jgi:hypothetical protein